MSTAVHSAALLIQLPFVITMQIIVRVVHPTIDQDLSAVRRRIKSSIH